jgi:hypothetical protein
MIAFKTFLQIDEAQRPLNIPLTWPWQEMVISEQDTIQYELLGFTVVSEDQYLIYKSNHQAEFDAWYANYSKEAQYWKIYDFISDKAKYDTTKPPLSLDFRTSLSIVLHRKSTVIKGECTTEEYYENCSVNAQGNLTYTNLIVSEHHAFTRDPLGFPVFRKSHVHYYDKNGIESSETKNWTKFYSPLEKIQEGKTRRSNLVDNLQMPVIGLISIAMNGTMNPSNAVILAGRKFLFDYKKEFDAFIDESNKEIVYCLSNPANTNYASVSKYPWINSMTPYGVTIRQFLMGELTI